MSKTRTQTQTRERFAKLQAQLVTAKSAELTYRIDLEVRYGGNRHWATRAETEKHDQLRARADRAFDKLMALITSIGGRDWNSKVPCSYFEVVTFDDIITRDQLVTVPPPAYGYDKTDMARFAFPVKGGR